MFEQLGRGEGEEKKRGREGTRTIFAPEAINFGADLQCQIAQDGFAGRVELKAVMRRVFEVTLGVGPLLEENPGSLTAETVVVGDNAQERKAAGKHFGAKAGVTANVGAAGLPRVIGAGAITSGGFGQERLLCEKERLVKFRQTDRIDGDVPLNSIEASGRLESWNLL